MALPVVLNEKIVNFLTSLPNIHDGSSQRALIYSAGLDTQLQNQIRFNEPVEQFFQLLVSTSRDYGTLKDGRDALKAILEAAKKYVGQDRKENCDRLIQEYDAFLQNLLHQFSVKSTRLPKQISPQKPQIGPIVHKMSNRQDQDNDFLKFFCPKIMENFGQPQFYFIHGKEDECHESFIERLENTHIKKYVEHKYGEQDADIYSKLVLWPYRGNLETRKEDIRINFMKTFEGVYMKDIDSLASTLSQFLASHKRSVILIRHNIYTSQWDQYNGQLIMWYINECWTKLEGHDNTPQFLIFLNIIYPTTKRLNLRQRVFWWSHYSKERVKKQILHIHRCWGDPDPCQLIEELTPVTRIDVNEWFSFYGIYEDEWRRKEKINSIFREKDQTVGYKSMVEIEKHLKEIIEEYQRLRK